MATLSVSAPPLSPITKQTVVIFGDSITAQNTNGSDSGAAWGSSAARGYWTHATRKLRHRFLLLNNAGVGGDRTDQMLARIQADVLAYSPGWVVVQGGGNDVGQDVASATIIAYLTAIYTMLIAAGYVVVATTILPTTSASTAPRKAALYTVNNWIRAYAQATPGMILCDWFPVQADPSTGDPAANMTYDGITHLSQQGAYALGAFLADVLAPLTYPADPLPFSNAETGLILPNARMVGDTAGLATSTTLGPGAQLTYLTASKVARTDGIQGEWQQVVASGATGFWYVHQQSSTDVGGGNVSVGNRVYAVAEVEIDAGATMVVIAGEVPIQLAIVNQDASGTPAVYSGYAASSEGTYAGTIPTGRLVLRTPNYLLPSGSSRLFVRVMAQINGTVRVGRMQIYKATAAGLYG